MNPLPLFAALFVVPVAVALVLVDAGKRGLSRRTRRRWSGGVGVVSLGGFVASAALDGALVPAYNALLGRPVVVVTPLQLLTGLVLVGLAVSALAVLTYGVASRYGPLAAT
ncbi:hypothetical protein [Haloarcula salina]|uniref:Uncharacterized protein n=1 Tax=Haloarcula salina TaxID=1429914 RepID=A0AA41G3P8_9EURY|nr:hypothetical protein [Haloarcula salina]MBV0903755.1 hypothetical protein [Haloarcula salina]